MSRRRRRVFHSTEEKDVVRSEFQRRLVEAIFLTKGRRLRYFGLPGEQALDLGAWGGMIDFVSAVEMFPETLRSLEMNLDAHFEEIRYRTHLGSIDDVIITNNSRDPASGQWKQVPTTYRDDLGHWIWDFDIVYLDYFGTLLPYKQLKKDKRSVEKRAQALRHLFTIERQDGWQEWLLMITVECQLFGEEDQNIMQDYLAGCAKDLNHDAVAIVDFCLTACPEQHLQVARLIHATLSNLIADASKLADVHIRPRPTMIYQGSGRPMLFFAYQIVPQGTMAPPQDVLSLLRTPYVGLRSPADEPWFTVLPTQPPGLSLDDVRQALDFLPEKVVSIIIEGFNEHSG